jgi:DNA-nicking Smr family endonuclease
MSDKHITDDDFDLFRNEVRDAQPIRHEQRSTYKVKPEPKAKKLNSFNEDYSGESFSDMVSPEIIGNEDYLEYRGPGIQHKMFTKLRAGKVHIEAELDLHGLTITQAEPSLSQFLDICQQQGIRCARIIHGKGWGSRDNKPVLKSKINHWLRQSRFVLAFCSATIEDGGTGAVYVLLKRQFRD